MSCPICGKLCRCAEPRAYERRSITLADPEPYDDSEEQFASSLNRGPSHEDPEQELTGSTFLTSSTQRRIAAENVTTTATMEQPVQQTFEPSSEAAAENVWRNEVASRVQSYKARRRRRMGDETLSLNFESTAGNHVFLQPDRQEEPVYEEPAAASYAIQTSTAAPAYDETVEHHQSYLEADPEPMPVYEPPAPVPAKLIQFPRPSYLDPPSDELAEPMLDKPRILEVPEEVDAAPSPLADIKMESGLEDNAAAFQSMIELPLRVAPLPQRVFAGLVDLLMVMMATALFGLIVMETPAGALVHDRKSLLEAMGAVAGLLWALYKYIFLVHAGTTPGMQMAQLRIAHFDGLPVTRRERRFRAIALIISAFPLGLGLCWSFIDPDMLCWHDRISRTYPTAG